MHSKGDDVRLRLLVEIEPAHRRHVRLHSLRGRRRAHHLAGAPTRRFPSMARCRLWLRDSRVGRRGRLCEIFKDRRVVRRMGRGRLRVEVDTDVVEACAVNKL